MNNVKKIFVIILMILLFFLIKENDCYAMKIVLDPGHDKDDSGAVGHGIYERDLNLKVANYLQDYLSEYYDVTVIKTHNGDKHLELDERGMIALNNKADLFISLHFNSSSADDAHGAEGFVTRCTTFEKYNKNTSELLNKILYNLSKLGIYNRGSHTKLCGHVDGDPKYMYSDGIAADYYGIMRYAMKGDADDYGIPIDSGIGIPTILIEHAFMSGNTDYQFFDTDEDLQRIARADCDAIVEHYGLTKYDPTKVHSIKLENSKQEIALNDEIEINASVFPTTAINQKITYKSDNEEVVSVDEKGKIKAKSKGTANITITSEEGNKTATCTVVVVDADINISKMQINMMSGRTINIGVTAYPSTLSNNKIIYTSSDTSIATVDTNGVINGVGIGDIIIKVRLEFSGIEKEINVKVNDPEKYRIEVKQSNRNLVNNTISRISEKTIGVDLVNDIYLGENLELQLLNKDNEVKLLDNYIVTGDKIIIKDKYTKEYISEFNTVVTGDVNCDGKISPADYVLIRNHIMGKSVIQGLSISAADIKKDGNISPADYVLIRNHIMGKKVINPQ